MAGTQIATYRGVAAAIAGAAAMAASCPAAAENMLPDNWNTAAYGNSTLSFNGYTRVTVGTSGDGKTMAEFQAPGAWSKYRLGNESNTYSELALDYHYYLDGPDDKKSRFVELYGMLSDYEPNNRYNDVLQDYQHLNNDNLAQSYIKLGNFLGDGVDAWFGRRYYDRHDIHMNDYYWLNSGQGAQFGGGVEGIPLAGHRLDVALFKAHDFDVNDLNGGSQTGSINTYTLDMRYRDIRTVPDGALSLWAQYADRPASENIGFSDKQGFGFGGWHVLKNVWGGTMTSALSFRKGPTITQGPYTDLSAREDQGYDLNKAFAVEADNDLVIDNLEKNYSVQWATVLRHEDRGCCGVQGDTIDWVSTGVRPVYYLTEHLGIATEVGLDYVDDAVLDKSGLLAKGTVALQLAGGKGYFNRPVIRLFVTEAAWTNGLRGSIGTTPGAAPFANDTSGTTVGIQFESWW